MEIQKLPYLEPDEKRLTARARAASLRDHYLGFLAHHPGSEEVRVPEETIHDIIEFAAQEHSLTLENITVLARRMVILAKATRQPKEMKLGLCRCQEILARAMGYRTYAALYALNVRGVFSRKRKVEVTNIGPRYRDQKLPVSQQMALRETPDIRYKRRRVILKLKETP